MKSNAEGDHRTSSIGNRDGKSTLKRLKISEQSAEEFFFRTHPFSDLVLLVEGKTVETKRNETSNFFHLDKELFVDKSVLAAGSKVFRSYFDDENVDTIELLDVSPEDLIELLRFVYPQFECSINNENVTILLILGRTGFFSSLFSIDSNVVSSF